MYLQPDLTGGWWVTMALSSRIQTIGKVGGVAAGTAPYVRRLARDEGLREDAADFIRSANNLMGHIRDDKKLRRDVRTMMESVTQEGGTGLRTRVPGYRVAGKTGTAHKLVDGRYAPDRYLSSFVGMAPASNPRLIIGVVIDEPSGGVYYGGSVAGPVFAQVMAASLRQLALPPDAPETATRMTHNTQPAVARAGGGA